MARKFQVHERAPHIPNRCAVTGTTGSKDNPLIDLNVQIDYYGMVYISYAIIAAIADQLGFAAPDVANALRTENETLKERVNRVPAVIERLSNDIRDISISATADLLSDTPAIVRDNDESAEQSNTRANLDYFGDDNTSEPDSESTGSEGPTSVPASGSSKRTTKPAPRTSSSSN